MATVAPTHTLYTMDYIDKSTGRWRWTAYGRRTLSILNVHTEPPISCERPNWNDDVLFSNMGRYLLKPSILTVAVKRVRGVVLFKFTIKQREFSNSNNILTITY